MLSLTEYEGLRLKHTAKHSQARAERIAYRVCRTTGERLFVFIDSRDERGNFKVISDAHGEGTASAYYLATGVKRDPLVERGVRGLVKHIPLREYAE